MNNSIIEIANKFYKEHQLVLLPTEKASNIVLNKRTNTLELLAGFITSNPAYQTQHLYFLSDEEIKELP